MLHILEYVIVIKTSFIAVFVVLTTDTDKNFVGKRGENHGLTICQLAAFVQQEQINGRTLYIISWFEEGILSS